MPSLLLVNIIIASLPTQDELARSKHLNASLLRYPASFLALRLLRNLLATAEKHPCLDLILVLSITPSRLLADLLSLRPRNTIALEAEIAALRLLRAVTSLQEKRIPLR